MKGEMCSFEHAMRCDGMRNERRCDGMRNERRCDGMRRCCGLAETQHPFDVLVVVVDGGGDQFVILF